MHRITTAAILLCLALTGIALTSGCKATGHAAGDTAQTVERGADQFEEGYEEGKAD